MKKYIPKPGREIVDRNLSKKYKQRIVHLNSHTDQVVYKAFWLSPDRQNKKSKLWCFSHFRGAKRALPKLLHSGTVYPDYSMLNKRAR